MKKFTRIAVLLLCAMTLSLVVYFGVYAEPSEDMDITMPRATPVIDGEIEETGVWSEAFLFNENTADCFWTGNQLFARAKLYFAYDMKGLYFAADITDNKTGKGLVLTSGADEDYGYNGDVMTLMLDPTGVFEKSSYQSTPWYNVGVFEDGTLGVYRVNGNAGDISAQTDIEGGLTDEGWRFEMFLPWNTIVADVSAASEGQYTINGLELIGGGAPTRAAAMYLDRYQKNINTVDTWGRYITVCDVTHDGYNGSDTSGTGAKSFGLKLINGPVNEHIWSSWQTVSQPDCTNDGKKSRYCSHCDTTEEVILEAQGHQYTHWQVTKEPTDTEPGEKMRKCKVCDMTETINFDGYDPLIVAYYNVAANSIGSHEYTHIDVLNFHPASIALDSNHSGEGIFTHQSSRLETYRKIAREQNPDIKFLFTVATNNLQVFESWFYTNRTAEKLAAEVLAVVERYDYDGFDIDYEFPSANLERSQGFVHFMKTMRQGLDALGEKTGKEYYLSMAVPGTQWTFSLFDMEALADYVDYFNMMNYDLYLNQGITHHHTPAYDNDPSTGLVGGSVYGDIQLYIQRGIPKSKIVAGCGAYSIHWTNVFSEGDGLYTAGTRTPNNYHLSLLEYSFVNRGGWVRYWDDTAKAPYLYNSRTHEFISYDDAESIKVKCEIVAEQDVRGIMVFDYCTSDGLGLYDNMYNWLTEANAKPDDPKPDDPKPDDPKPTPDVEVFTDLDREAWYYDSVKYCVERGYAVGTSDTTFSPAKTLTRAEFVMLLAKLEGVDLDAYRDEQHRFSDVEQGSWYYGAVIWAAEQGYAAGVGGGVFLPSADVTREQMVRMLYLYAESKGMDVTKGADLSGYTDNGDVSAWARSQVEWAVEQGIISGTSATTLSPRATATRAEAMRIFMVFDALNKE